MKNIFVIDGVVGGVWQQQRRGRRIDIQVEAFQPLSADQQRELEAAAARIGEIVGAESALSLGAIDTRPHL